MLGLNGFPHPPAYLVAGQAVANSGDNIGEYKPPPYLPEELRTHELITTLDFYKQALALTVVVVVTFIDSFAAATVQIFCFFSRPFCDPIIVIIVSLCKYAFVR